MTPEELAEMKAAEIEFESHDTTDERRVELIERLLEIAETENLPYSRCNSCKKYPVHVPYSYALCPGHVYSQEGMRDVFIIRMCEYCFDNMCSYDEDAPRVGPR
jgi:hypothetical protein